MQLSDDPKLAARCKVLSREVGEGAKRVHALANVSGGAPVSPFAARPTADEVVGRCGGGGRQDMVETPPCYWGALEYAKLANAGERKRVGGHSVGAVGTVGKVPPGGEAPGGA